MRYIRTRRRDPERGESLVEILISVAIISIAVVAVVGAVVTAVRASDIHRKRATAGAEVRVFADALQTAVTRTPTRYVDATCATPASYNGIYTPPSGFTAEVTQVRFWSPTQKQFVATCPPDIGIQQVSVRVSSADGRASETLNVILRKPCRPGDAACS